MGNERFVLLDGFPAGGTNEQMLVELGLLFLGQFA